MKNTKTNKISTNPVTLATRDAYEQALINCEDAEEAARTACIAFDAALITLDAARITLDSVRIAFESAIRAEP